MSSAGCSDTTRFETFDVPEAGTLDVFATADEVLQGLSAVGYVGNPRIGVTIHLASRLGKAVLVEGPSGTGKTALAKALSASTGRRIVRLQCHEGLDQSKALYDWDHRRQILHIQQAASGDEQPVDLFDESFLLVRPLLEAIRATDDVILLIDEVDRMDIETEALLLEVLAEFQISIPEIGTVRARRRPFVLLTSNNTRELSEALKRRCLYLPLDYPSMEREREIISTHVPTIHDGLAQTVAQVVQVLRNMDLAKSPSVSEVVDWARALVIDEAKTIDSETVVAGLPVLLKNRSDVDAAAARFREPT